MFCGCTYGTNACRYRMRIVPLDRSVATADAVGLAANDHEMSTWIYAIALACGTWYFSILLVQAIGFTQLYRHYSLKPKPAVSPSLPLDDIPHITILRPVKGLEPQLYECLAATFKQDYPSDKLTIYFCVASAGDLAYPVLTRLLADFPQFDARLFVEEEDPNLSGNDGETTNLGPNPKIRNLSRAYRQAKGDIVWIVDCNVWVGRGVAGRMVDKLCGYGVEGKRLTPYKLVHQLPLVVDSVGASAGEEARGLLRNHCDGKHPVTCSSSSAYHTAFTPQEGSQVLSTLRIGGGRLEEMFMATSHAKFYTAINTVAIAPCIVGKSNMFRRSHLEFLTSDTSHYSPGIDFFSENICEDHLIGDLLWRKKVPNGGNWHNHGLVFGDLAIQPMAGMSVSDYIARRVRWLRVRKWTVTLATFVEPGIEPLLCSAYGSFAITTLPWFHAVFRIPQTWLAFIIIWLLSISAWMTLDSFVYAGLHSGSSIELDADTPSFARPRDGYGRRPFGQWLLAWLGREFLALPIWVWACYGGTTVIWRGKKFRVGLDMKVKEIETKKGTTAQNTENRRARVKDRQD